MNFLLGISRAIDYVTTKLGQLMWWMSLFMVLIGAFNVITRYAFGPISQIFGTNVAQLLSGNRYLSMQTFAYDMIFLLGAAYVLKSDGHVRVDIVYSSLKAKAKAWIDILGAAFFLIPFCWFAFAFSRKNIFSSWAKLEASPDPGGIPLYIIKTVVPVALFILIFQGISEIIKNLAFLSGHPKSGSIHQTHEEKRPGEHVVEQTEGF
ncbi:MAG: TRAP transporter small permease subunit [Trueperaceae bacterium]|nr:TRAP transporter small permease subunit [Trueperaceae bacterium]